MCIRDRLSPLYPELRNLVLKTVGLADILRAALQDERIQVAFVFGSIAEGKETADSDVDLLSLENWACAQFQSCSQVLQKRLEEKSILT